MPELELPCYRTDLDRLHVTHLDRLYKKEVGGVPMSSMTRRERIDAIVKVLQATERYLGDKRNDSAAAMRDSYEIQQRLASIVAQHIADRPRQEAMLRDLMDFLRQEKVI